MSRLLGAELRRIAARRMTRFFPAVLALLFVGGIVIAYFVIDNDPDNSPDLINDIAGGVDATDLLGPIASLLAVMAFVIGASSIGADIKTGMLEQILTWEPRRLRFLVARLAAGFVASTVIAMVLSAFFITLLYGLAATTGTVDGVTGEFVTNIAWIVVRTGIGTGLFCCFGVAITVLVNSSVGSIVGFVIYWFIVENFLLTAFLPAVAVFLPVTNADAFGRGADVQRVSGSIFSDDFDLVVEHGYVTAGVILLIWTTLATVAAMAVFRVRDID